MAAKDPLSTVFAALADPTRRAILTHLAQGPTTVGQIAEPFAMSRPAVSQHLRVLEDAGLVERTVTAQWRTCTLRTEPLDEIASWVDRHRRYWDERFDLLEDRLRAARDVPGSRPQEETTDE
ncbi:metalloregulator ArsR/SmtB family transcription factor [Cellulomonas sp.]|uniref:ArsR/SmtB family transcription factor n=1 Tax=Cellulomonas sp. TaxID=40001 RepID=UPI001B02C737|nr:metalloregulator ArsR/SmtB family transcription factor [Cellulomonas sp.]MBO9554733.1 winged helix-turn-helix transcriptional regulator [Cellulomonas sp.]